MSRIPELRIYNNEKLMNDYNDMQIRIKAHLFEIGSPEFKLRNPKPTVEELDSLMKRVFDVLKQDSQPMRKY